MHNVHITATHEFVYEIILEEALRKTSVAPLPSATNLGRFHQNSNSSMFPELYEPCNYLCTASFSKCNGIEEYHKNKILLLCILKRMTRLPTYCTQTQQRLASYHTVFQLTIHQRDSASATWLSFPAMWRTSVVYSLIAES